MKNNVVGTVHIYSHFSFLYGVFIRRLFYSGLVYCYYWCPKGRQGYFTYFWGILNVGYLMLTATNYRNNGSVVLKQHPIFFRTKNPVTYNVHMYISDLEDFYTFWEKNGAVGIVWTENVHSSISLFSSIQLCSQMQKTLT